jgi:hypothetical protein
VNHPFGPIKGGLKSIGPIGFGVIAFFSIGLFRGGDTGRTGCTGTDCCVPVSLSTPNSVRNEMVFAAAPSKRTWVVPLNLTFSKLNAPPLYVSSALSNVQSWQFNPSSVCQEFLSVTLLTVIARGGTTGTAARVSTSGTCCSLLADAVVTPSKNSLEQHTPKTNVNSSSE